MRLIAPFDPLQYRAVPQSIPVTCVLQALERRLVPRHSAAPSELDPWLTAVRRYRCAAAMRRRLTEEVAEISARAERAAVVPQGGNTRLFAGRFPASGALLLSMRRLEPVARSRSRAPADMRGGVVRKSSEESAGAECAPSLAGSKGSARSRLISTNAGVTQVFASGRFLACPDSRRSSDCSIFDVSRTEVASRHDLRHC